MATHRQSDAGPLQTRFSPGLTHDITVALCDYVAQQDGAADATLHALTNRVCSEAKTLGLPPEKMLIEIKNLFEHFPIADAPAAELRRRMFERFITGCIESYFSTDE